MLFHKNFVRRILCTICVIPALSAAQQNPFANAAPQNINEYFLDKSILEQPAQQHYKSIQETENYMLSFPWIQQMLFEDKKIKDNQHKKMPESYVITRQAPLDVIDEEEEKDEIKAVSDDEQDTPADDPAQTFALLSAKGGLEKLIACQDSSAGIYGIIHNLLPTDKYNVVIRAMQRHGLSQNINVYYRDLSRLSTGKSKLCKTLLQTQDRVISIHDFLLLPSNEIERTQERKSLAQFHSLAKYATLSFSTMSISPEGNFLIGRIQPVAQDMRNIRGLDHIYILFPIYQHHAMRPIAFPFTGSTSFVDFVQKANKPDLYQLCIGGTLFDINNYQEHIDKVQSTAIEPQEWQGKKYIATGWNIANPFAKSDDKNAYYIVPQKKIQLYVDSIKTYRPSLIQRKDPLQGSTTIPLHNVSSSVCSHKAKHPYAFFLYHTAQDCLDNDAQYNLLAMRIGGTQPIYIHTTLPEGNYQTSLYEHQADETSPSILFVSAQHTIVAISTKVFHWSSSKVKVDDKSIRLANDLCATDHSDPQPASAHAYYIKTFTTISNRTIVDIATCNLGEIVYRKLIKDKIAWLHRLLVALDQGTIVVYDWTYQGQKDFNQRNLTLIPQYVLETGMTIQQIVTSNGYDRLFVASSKPAIDYPAPQQSYLVTTDPTHKQADNISIKLYYRDEQTFGGISVYDLYAIKDIKASSSQSSDLPSHIVLTRLNNQGKQLQQLLVTSRDLGTKASKRDDDTAQFVFVLNQNEPLRKWVIQSRIPDMPAPTTADLDMSEQLPASNDIEQEIKEEPIIQEQKVDKDSSHDILYDDDDIDSSSPNNIDMHNSSNSDGFYDIGNAMQASDDYKVRDSSDLFINNMDIPRYLPNEIAVENMDYDPINEVD